MVTNSSPDFYISGKTVLQKMKEITAGDKLLLLTNWLEIERHKHPAGGSLRFATKTIAASNALDTTKADFDAVAPAISAHVTIQAALNALPAGGGKVLLSEGLFDIGAQISVPANCSVEGMGASTILRVHAGVDLGHSGGLGGGLFDGTTNNVSISNLQIDGNRANAAVNVSGCQNNGVWLYTNLTIVNCDSAGITTVANAIITDCTFNNCGGGGGGATGTASIDVRAGTVIIANNSIIMPNLANPGIRLGGGVGIVTSNHITGNTASATHGIETDGANGLFISNNRIINCSNGIHLGATNNEGDFILVGGNFIQGCTGWGILIETGGGQLGTDDAIKDNYIRSCAGGILIQFDAGDSISITNNTIVGHTNKGIHLLGGNPGGITNAYVTDNLIRGAGAGTTGLLISANCSTCTVINNDCHAGGAATFTDAGVGTIKNLDGSANNWNRIL
jgi:hypothetical protein